MLVSEKYLEFVIEKLQDVKNTQLNNISEAAGCIAEACMNGGNFFCFRFRTFTYSG